MGNSDSRRTMGLEYGTSVELKINEEVKYADGLAVVLTSFSHKRPITGGPTKATAYLTLKKNGAKDELMLSVHGVQGKPAAKDGLSDSERYDSKVWTEYEFQLKAFDYNRSIKVVIAHRNE